MLARENLLWCKAAKVSQQAMSQRFLSFPAVLFERVFFELLPQLQPRWQQRTKRPLRRSVKFATEQFEQIWIAESSTLEALFGKLDSLQDEPVETLAGKMAIAASLAAHRTSTKHAVFSRLVQSSQN